jgi:regulator of sirC expression with transglutaminase-like and TPR domain
LDLCITTRSAWHAVWADSVHARERLDSADHRLRRGVVWWPAHDYLRRLNLALARAWELAGEPERALQAVRRRLGFLRIDRYLAESLRDEGRLAAAVGDTAGAIYAYEYYLELRSDPEPELLPEVAEVRAALEALR